MGRLGSMAKWEKADLAKKDKVHFKSSGYKLIGIYFMKPFLKVTTIMGPFTSRKAFFRKDRKRY
jgi:hypothetical protein